MPLPPGGDAPWPPAYLKDPFAQMSILAAWWEGDPERLSAVYGGTADAAATAQKSFERPTQYRGGVVGTVARWFWGQPTAPQQQRTKVHIPLASEIATASADLLFSRSITVTFGDEDARRADRDVQVQAAQDEADAQAAADHEAGLNDAGIDPAEPDPYTGLPPQPPKADPIDAPDVPPDPAQQRFDQLREASMLDATLLEAAEVAAAMTGVYLRLVWDEEVQDGPWIDVVHPDSAVPEFRYGRLWAVTFWRELVSADDKTKGKVVRHLERHERGKILHGLYEGDRDSLGRPIPVSEAPDLEGLVEDLENGNEIPTVEGRLSACYIPNMRPAPAWRRSPQLAPLGRSDYTPGVLALMDQLDEVMTSWMRDIRLGKARIQVPEQYLETQGRGKGATFDEDREVYTKLNLLPSPGGPPQITATQFAIRVDEHERTARALMDAIVRAAGYSSQTFGSDSEGAGATTATEITSREKRSVLTREKKIRYWDAALSDLFYTWLLLDAQLAGVQAPPPAADTAPQPGQPDGDAPAEPGKDTGTGGQKPMAGKQGVPAPGPPGTKPAPGDAKAPAGKAKPFAKGKPGSTPFGQKPTPARTAPNGQPAGTTPPGQVPPGQPAQGKPAGARPTLGALAKVKPGEIPAQTGDELDPAMVDPNAPAAPVIPDGPPELTWPALADADGLTLAQTAQALFAASAASKYTLVKLVHPDWDEDQVNDELARMDEDTAAAAPPDPMSMGAEQPFGGGAPFGQDGDQPPEDNPGADQGGGGGFPFQQ